MDAAQPRSTDHMQNAQYTETFQAFLPPKSMQDFRKYGGNQSQHMNLVV